MSSPEYPAYEVIKAFTEINGKKTPHWWNHHRRHVSSRTRLRSLQKTRICSIRWLVKTRPSTRRGIERSFTWIAMRSKRLQRVVADWLSSWQSADSSPSARAACWPHSFSKALCPCLGSVSLNQGRCLFLVWYNLRYGKSPPHTQDTQVSSS